MTTISSSFIKKGTLTVGILSTSILFITAIASAWTGPSATPPAGNVATPINTSGTEQSKTGILDVYGLFVNGSSQYIYFGATNATTGFGIRNNAGTIEFKSTAGGTWQPFNSILQSYFATGSTNTVNQIRFADGTVQTTAATGSGTIPTGTRDDAGLQGNAGAVNGFFQSSAPVNYPTGASSWWHLLDVRHSNTANNYAMQIAGSFFDQELYFRKVAGTATTGWSKFVAENISGNVGIGNIGPTTKLDVTGSIRATSSIYSGYGGANGYVGLVAGNSGNAGYIHWFRPDGTTRIGYMGWGTSGANNLNLTLENGAIFNVNGGNVGIGTTGPLASLYVTRGPAGNTHGTAVFSGTTNASHFNYSTNEDTYIRGGKATSALYLNDTASGNIMIGGGGGKTQIMGGGIDSTLGDSILFNNTAYQGSFYNKIRNSHSSAPASSLMTFDLSTGAATTLEVMRLRGDGNVNIAGNFNTAGRGQTDWYNINTGTIGAWSSIYSYGYLCTGNSSGACTGTGGVVLAAGGTITAVGNVTAAGYFHSSDATLKRNIQTASGLSTIEKLRGVTFTWKESGKKSSGVIAQEVEKVLPEAVQTDKQGLKSVDYDQLIAPLIEAVKEQQLQIEELRHEIKILKEVR